MTMCNAQGFSAFQLLFNGWSVLRDDRYGISSDYGPMHKRREDVDLILEFNGMCPEIGLIKALVKYTDGGAGSLGPSVNYEGSGLLSLAIRTSDEELIDALLMYDNEVDRRDRLPDDDGIPSRSDSLPIEAKTPLEWLCFAEVLGTDVITKILDLSHTLEKQGYFGMMPMHIAVRESNWAVLGELLNRGLDADFLDDLSRTPLAEACVANDPEAIRLLYEKRARKIAKNDTYALLAAFEKGFMDRSFGYA